jgi:hypothetical protein
LGSDAGVSVVGETVIRRRRYHSGTFNISFLER